MSTPRPIAVDFDGTCVTHEYPKIGREIGAVPVLKRLVEAGHQVILYTMRSGKQLEEAVAWFDKNEIPLYGVQFNPTQKDWTQSNKCYAALYIDDAALGAPLIHDKSFHYRPYINWSLAETMLEYSGYLNPLHNV
jgi:hypothetical protein